jgi:hypothetical protein
VVASRRAIAQLERLFGSEPILIEQVFDVKASVDPILRDRRDI